MGGLYVDQRLNQNGLAAKKETRFARLWIGHVLFAPADHVLVHDREHDEVDPALVADIRAKGIENPLLVWSAGVQEGVERFYVINGARRKIHATIAEREMVEAGELPARKSDPPYLYVPIEIFEGTANEALLERVRRNRDPHKKPDSPSVLYAQFSRLVRVGYEEREIEAAAPGMDVAAVLRWPSVHEKVRVRLDAGEAPLSVLSAIVDVPYEKQEATFEAMVAAGAITPRKAKRLAKKITGVVPVFRPPSLVVLAAMREAARAPEMANNDLFVAPVADVLAYLAGERGLLSAEVESRLDAARAAASKPGRRKVLEEKVPEEKEVPSHESKSARLDRIRNEARKLGLAR